MYRLEIRYEYIIMNRKHKNVYVYEDSITKTKKLKQKLSKTSKTHIK